MDRFHGADDLPLIRMIQTIKRIEDSRSHNYQSKTVDLATFVPKYPNVVWVDQSYRAKKNGKMTVLTHPPGLTTHCATGQRIRVLWVNKFSDALRANDLFYSRLSWPDRMSDGGWTIILTEGWEGSRRGQISTT